MYKIFILGSCVSRDTLNFDVGNIFHLNKYYARTSWAALCSGPIHQKPDTSLIESAFQKRIVDYEVERQFFSDIAIDDSDFILIDFIDERFGLLEVDEGAYLTLSNELVKTGIFTPDMKKTERYIRSGSQKHRELWLKGAEAIFKRFNELKITPKVRVSKVFWSTVFEDGSPLPDKFSLEVADKANEFLAWIYLQLEKYIEKSQFIECTRSSFKVKKDHRWGVSPFHYIDEYYLETIKLLLTSK